MKGMTKEKERRSFGDFIEAMVRTSKATQFQVLVAKNPIHRPGHRAV